MTRIRIHPVVISLLLSSCLLAASGKREERKFQVNPADTRATRAAPNTPLRAGGTNHNFKLFAWHGHEYMPMPPGTVPLIDRASEALALDRCRPKNQD